MSWHSRFIICLQESVFINYLQIGGFFAQNVDLVPDIRLISQLELICLTQRDRNDIVLFVIYVLKEKEDTILDSSSLMVQYRPCCVAHTSTPAELPG